MSLTAYLVRSERRLRADLAQLRLLPSCPVERAGRNVDLPWLAAPTRAERRLTRERSVSGRAARVRMVSRLPAPSSASRRPRGRREEPAAGPSVPESPSSVVSRASAFRSQAPHCQLECDGSLSASLRRAAQAAGITGLCGQPALPALSALCALHAPLAPLRTCLLALR